MKLLSAVLFLALVPSTHAAIYGDDDRVEYKNVSNILYRQVAQAAAAAIPTNRLQQTAYFTTRIVAPTFGPSMNLCKNERFYEQPAAAECSGFLVADDILVTAGHCTQDHDLCKDHKWVFGYRINHDGQTEFEVPSENVYGCKVLHEAFTMANFVDYSILKLDRKVKGFAPVGYRKDSKTKVQTKVVIAGFPRGLPLKLAEGIVTEVKPTYLTTNLDAFSVNSGSMVFNAQTGEVEGILSSGPFDFEDSSEGCSVSRRLSEKEAMTTVSRIRLLAALIEASKAND